MVVDRDIGDLEARGAGTGRRRGLNINAAQIGRSIQSEATKADIVGCNIDSVAGGDPTTVNRSRALARTRQRQRSADVKRGWQGVIASLNIDCIAARSRVHAVLDRARGLCHINISSLQACEATGAIVQSIGDEIFSREEFIVCHGRADLAVELYLRHVDIAAATPEQMLLGLRTADEVVARTKDQSTSARAARQLDVIGIVGERVAREIRGGGRVLPHQSE